MEREAPGTARADEAAVPPAEQIGRVRVRDEGADGPLDAPLPPPAEEGGWSPQALILGVVALLIIVGALLLIVWGSFQL